VGVPTINGEPFQLIPFLHDDAVPWVPFIYAKQGPLHPAAPCHALRRRCVAHAAAAGWTCVDRLYNAKVF
jgi:hypothetical protein